MEEPVSAGSCAVSLVGYPVLHIAGKSLVHIRVAPRPPCTSIREYATVHCGYSSGGADYLSPQSSGATADDHTSEGTSDVHSVSLTKEGSEANAPFTCEGVTASTRDGTQHRATSDVLS